MSDAAHIYNLLLKQGIIGAQGNMTFNFFGQNIQVTSLDVVGSIIQNWVETWMIQYQIPYRLAQHSQNWPDFILNDGTELEIKAFNSAAGPNFDIANFDTYTRSLVTHSERLRTEHLVFGYTLSPTGVVTITELHLLKVWEMTGPSNTNILNLQVKQDVVHNIRPKNWRSTGVTIFTSRRDFVYHLHLALQRFYPTRCPNFFDLVEADFIRKTGQNL